MAKTRLEIDRQIHRAAGVMLATLERRQVRNRPTYRSHIRRSWPEETIVHPLLRSQMTNGAPMKPGLKLAVGAVADLIQLDDLKVRTAATVVARKLVNYWISNAKGSDDFERLAPVQNRSTVTIGPPETKPERLRAAAVRSVAASLVTSYYRTRNKSEL